MSRQELPPEIDPTKYNLYLLEGLPDVPVAPALSERANDLKNERTSDTGKPAKPAKDPILEKLKQKVVVWLGKSLDDIAHTSFKYYADEVMTQKESRVFFSDQLILYTIRLMQFISMRYPGLWTTHKQSIIKQYDDNSKEALEYLMKKYPLKEGGSVMPELETLIPLIDRTQDMNYDMLNKAGITFTRGNIGSTVKSMLNYFIQLSKRLLPDFRKEMTKIFTLPNKEGKEQPIYNLIGMKFSDNLEQYSDAEIKEAGIKIKGPEVLRVIIKWIEGLENRCKEVDKYIMNRYYPFVSMDGKDVKLTFKDRDLLATNVRKQFELVKEYDKKTNGKVATILFDLFEFIKTQKERFRYIEEKQVETGLFTTILASSISSMAAQFLQTLIDHILCSTDKYRLITFNVSDLLRSKCVGDKDQIKEIFARLEKVFTVVRVKNRLHTSNHDFMCNFYYQGILCQVQLGIAVKKGSQSHSHKQDCYGHFSHFLYELSRSKFSALTQAAIINNSGNPCIVYFRDKLTKRRKTRINTSFLQEIKVSVKNGRISIVQFQPRQNTTPQFCNYCCQFKPAYSSFLDMFQSVKIGKKICGQCYIEKLDKKAKAQFLIGDLSQFFQEVEDINAYLKSFMSFQQYYMLVLFKTYNKKVQALHKPKSMDDLCDVLIRYRQNIKYNFYDKKSIEQKAFFIFQLKKQLTVFKDPREMFHNHKDLSFVDPEVMLSQLKDPNEQLLYVLNQQRMLILNNECTNQLKRQRHNMIKIKTLGDKDWWVMEAQNIDQSFFENKRIKGFLQSVKKLEISDNHLKQLSFLAKRSLVHLNVSGNQIAAIDLRDFKFEQLKYLNLSKNLIQVIKLYDCKLTLLEIFIADRNKLTSVDFGAAFLPVLKQLQLDNNRLMKLDNFGNIPFNELEKLYLQENLLENTEFLRQKQLKSLLVFRIENNKLNNLDGLYTTDMPKIQYLSLGSIGTLDLKNWNKYKMGQLKQLYIRNGSNVEGLKNLNRFYSLQKITIEVNKFKNLEFGQLNLKQLTELTIVNNELEAIESLRKVTMQNLKILDLKKNRLKTMDFTGLNFNEITDLYLQKNNLTHISCIDRCSMPHLRTFNLSDNMMEQLHFGSADFKSLRTLSVSRNRLRTIFGFSEVTQVMESQNNIINTLSNSSAAKKQANLPNLQELHLDDNKLEILILAKMNLPNLSVLNVQKNRISQIQGTRSAHLPKLAQLHMNQNTLKRLVMNQLEIPSLTQLYLSKCNIQTFLCQGEVRMPKLQSLDLSNNKLTNIDFTYFFAHQLRDLVLFNNSIHQFIALDPKHFVNLKSINMVENNLEYLSLDNMNFEKLQVMNYDNNRITKLNAMSKVQLKSLTTLTLSKNMLGMINFANLRMESLSKLDLRSNHIQIINNFNESQLKNLKSLLLDENEIQQIELKGTSAENLTSIDLSFNKLVKFDVVKHTKLNFLKIININNNNILNLDFDNVVLEQLVTLNAEVNNIDTVNFTKCEFPKITSINLKNNKLRLVEGLKQAKMPKLQEFYLEFNLIQHLDFKDANFPNLHTLNLRDNWLKSLIIDDARMPQIRFFYLNNTIPRRVRDKSGSQLDVFNRMQNLSLAKCQWLHIETLNLQASGISNLRGMSTAHMPKLRQLNLNANGLTQFQANKKYQLLEVVSLNSNKITTLESLRIKEITNLRYLTLSHNALTELSFENLAFACLQQLDLSYNNISKMSDLSQAKLPNLYELNLQNNKLQQFNLDRVHMHRLYILNLGENNLREVKGLNNCRLTNLSTLNLSTNLLMSLDFKGCNIPNIQYILLRDNPQLVSVIGLDDPIKPKLKQIDITGSPELRKNNFVFSGNNLSQEKQSTYRRMERHLES